MAHDAFARRAVVTAIEYFQSVLALREALLRLTEVVVEALPGASHAGIMMQVDGELQTSIFTHPSVPEIDRAQYRTGEGPCLDAIRTGEVYTIESTRVPGRWQAFRDSSARHGVLSTVSLPLHSDIGTIGALNVYSHRENAFDGDVVLAESLAQFASMVLRNASTYWDSDSLDETVADAVDARDEREMAKGLVMGRDRCSADVAQASLVAMARSEALTLRALCKKLLADGSESSPWH